MIGNRKAFKQAATGYLCVVVFLGVGLAVYGTTWRRWIDHGWILGVWGIVAIGSLVAMLFAWQRAKDGDSVAPLYLHNLLSKKVGRWMLGHDDTDAAH